MIERFTPAWAADLPLRMAKLHSFLDQGGVINGPAVSVSGGTDLLLFYWSVL